MLPYALKLAFSRKQDDKSPGDISQFQSLMMALAATIGTGNIAGVATAVVLGGPGAIFWMWASALVGMATKYAEGLLAIKYRFKDKNGEMSGGPMHYIERGLNMKWLAIRQGKVNKKATRQETHTPKIFNDLANRKNSKNEATLSFALGFLL
jgi:AGCS family alanine or glycine:cation symporter